MARMSACRWQLEAEASHYLFYNITDTWQIPQHHVSTQPRPPPHPALSFCHQLQGSRHMYYSNSISCRPNRHILSLICKQTATNKTKAMSKAGQGKSEEFCPLSPCVHAEPGGVCTLMEENVNEMREKKHTESLVRRGKVGEGDEEYLFLL